MQSGELLKFEVLYFSICYFCFDYHGIFWDHYICLFELRFDISSIFFCVFQQAEAVKLHTDLNVGMYWGDMGTDFWDADMWKQEIDNHEVRAFIFG